MTKREYMNELRDTLSEINFAEASELLEDYENHFQAGIAEGKSEEDIIKELGTVEELAEELKGFAEEKEQKTESRKEASVVETGTDADWENIDISLISADVIVRMAEDDKMHMEYKNDQKLWSKNKMTFIGYQEGNTFYAEEKRIGHSTASFSGSSKLYVWVPKKCKNIIVNGKSGDITVQNVIDLRKMNIKIMSGDISIQGGKIDTLHCDTMSGDVMIRNHESERLEAKSLSGDVKIEGTTYLRGDFSSTSGDVTVDELAKGSDASIQSVSGDVSVVVRDTACGDIKSTSGDVELIIEKECTGFEIRTKGTDFGFPSGSKGSRWGEMRIRSHEEIPYIDGAYCYGDRNAKFSMSTVSGDLSVKHYS